MDSRSNSLWAGLMDLANYLKVSSSNPTVVLSPYCNLEQRLDSVLTERKVVYLYPDDLVVDKVVVDRMETYYNHQEVQFVPAVHH